MAEETITAQTPEIDPGMSVVPEAPGLMDVPTVIPELGLAAQALASQVSFAKKTWKDGSGGGTPVTAAELNRLEQGVADLTNAVNGLRDSVSQIALNNCTLAVSANNDWFGIYVRGRGMSSFGMEVNATGKNVQFVKDGEPFKSL